MATSRVTLPALLVAFIAGLVAFQNAQNWSACLSGLALLIALFAYDQRGARNGWQSLAFAFVCGLAMLDASLYPLGGLLAGLVAANLVPVLIWLIGTFTFFLIDRSRMGYRQHAGSSAYLRPPDSQAPTTIFQAAQQRAFTPAPDYQAAPAYQPAPVYQPAAVAQAVEPVVQPHVQPVVQSEPVYIPAAASTPVAAPPPVRTGKEVSIYVNMMDEGMSVLRAVRAEHLGRDFYIIVDEMPADEKWEYVPGQVVRCRKKNLSNGKGLVAYEEAPRAQ
jgi:hypothetical protein